MELYSKAREKCSVTYRRTWEEFRKALGNNEFEYFELDKAKKCIFLSVLDNVLTYEKNMRYLTKNFNELYFHFSFCRATKIGDKEDITNIDFQRFLPNKNFIKDDNRFSPKGVEYLYLACKTRFGREKDYNSIIEGALSEIRAIDGDRVGICQFQISNMEDMEKRKVIDLTISDDKTFEELDEEIDSKMDKYMSERLNDYIDGDKVNKEKLEQDCRAYVEKLLLRLYFKFLSEEIFKPVEGVDKEYEYSPFHCMAEYFKGLGFDGIIYKSTVCKNGIAKNIVLFDKYFAEPQRYEIRNI